MTSASEPAAHPFSRVELIVAFAAAVGLVLSLPTAVSAQEGVLSGRVISESSGLALSGAQVYVEGTELGTISGEDGRYRIAGVPDGQRTIRARLIGYRTGSRTVAVSAGETTTVDFTLATTAISLQQVVVTAAGEQQIRELGNAVATLDAVQEVEKSGADNLSDLLTGKASGMMIRRTAGSVGTSSKIRVRGASSLSLNSRPLIYIDGARINAGTPGGGPGGKVLGQGWDRLNMVNPEEIESIEVVKGPAAATLYGTEAAGGVIRITTKEGSGQPRYTIEGEYGATWNDRRFPNSVWNPRSFFGAAAPDTVYTLNLIEEEKPFRVGDQSRLSATIQGGVETVNYYGSLQWENREGVTVTNSLEQVSARANFSVTPGDKFRIQLSNQFIHDNTFLPRADNAVEGWVAHSQLSSPWVMRLTRSDPNTGGPAIETCAQNFERSRAEGIPLADLGTDGCPATPAFAATTLEDLATVEDNKATERYIGSATVRYRPFEALTNRLTLGYDTFNDRIRTFFPVDPTQPFGSKSQGTIIRDHRTGRTITLEATSSLDYGLWLEDLQLNTTLGLQYFREDMTGAQVDGTTFPTGAPSVQNAVQTVATDRFLDERTMGVFVQQRFAWKDRLFVTPAIRFDDNSAFGQALGVQEYPRLSVSWAASDEPWMPDFFEQLKVRGAWGRSGKQPAPNNALALLRPVPVTIGNDNVLGVAAEQPGNEELRPEVGEEVELGFDLTSLEGRWNLSATYYDQTTRNVLVRRPLSPSEGFRMAKWENVAELSNWGVEVDTDYRLLDGQNLGWDVGLVFTSNENEITELPVGFPTDNSAQRFQEGRPFASYFAPTISLRDGEVVSAEESTYQGKPLPTFEGSLSTTVTLLGGDVQLYASGAYAFGQSLMNAEELFRCQWVGGGLHGGICPAMEERNSDGSLTDEALIKSEATRRGGSGVLASDPFVYESDYLRLRTVSAQIVLPEFIVGPTGASRGTLRLAGSNLLTWTRYPGIDPEVTQYGTEAEVGREQFFSLPVVPTASASLRLNF